MLSGKAEEILKSGSVSVRVKRAGMLQSQTLKVRRVEVCGERFVELYIGKILEMSELHRLADELGLPVEAENGRSFPEGKGAKDFIGL
jgi:hypothetical protein